MKKLIILAIVLITILLTSCATFNQRNGVNNQNKIAYQFNPVLYKAICQELNVKEITEQHLTETTGLDLNRYKIRSLKGIELFENLEELNLWGNQISDISSLAGLFKLKKLDLDHNQISDISPLARLFNLKKLWLLNFNQKIKQQDIDLLKQYLKNCEIYD